MKQLHICYVEMGYPHHHGGGGGAGTYVRLAGRELARQGHKVSVIAAPCSQCAAYAVDDGIEVYRPNLHHSLHWYAGKLPGIRAGAIALRYLEQGWSIAQFLDQLHKRNPVDLVEYTEGGDFWHTRRAPFPFIVHLHGSRYTFLRMSSRPVGRKDWYHRRLELAFIRQAQIVISPSRALLDIVAGELGHAPKQVTVLPYPLDPMLLTNVVAPGQSASPHPVVLFAARNDPVKGADTLLRAVPLIKREIPNAEFHCFGYTPAPDTQLPDGVRCYSFVAKEDLLVHYRQADICVIPSLWDNSPNTVYEAMAAGKAVVASRVGGIPELVVDGETGVLVDPNDPEQLAAAIVRLLRSESERLDMGRKGRAHIRQLADLHDNVSRRVELYAQVINNWSPQSASWNYAHRSR